MSLQCSRLIRDIKQIYNFRSPLKIFKRLVSSDTSTEENKSKGGFARAFIKHSHLDETPRKEDASFPSLLRNSKLIDLGDPEGRIVSGTIFHIVEDDLYIDFGWKFHCVCRRPLKNGSDYVLGSKVRLRIKDLELSTKFLGSEKDLTLLEPMLSF